MNTRLDSNCSNSLFQQDIPCPLDTYRFCKVDHLRNEC